MTHVSSWFDRVERERKRQRLPVDDLLTKLGISRATYYQYKSQPQRRPRDQETVDRIAAFLGEDAATLKQELHPAPGPPPLELVEAAAARELNTRLYQQHIAALAHALGMSAGASTGPAAPRPEGVDVAARLLREQLRMPPNAVDAAVVVLPKARGRMGRIENGKGGPREDDAIFHDPYQFQIYVVPVPPEAGGSADGDREAAALLRRTQQKVDEIMDGPMLPVTREHSSNLALPLFRGRADVLLYPGLLDMRPPELVPRHPLPMKGDIVVTGVYYAGAPDVAALLARYLGYGFSTFQHLARLQIRAGLRALPDEPFKRAVAGVTAAVLRSQSPTVSPMVWSTNDPDEILLAGVEGHLPAFAGAVVLLELSDSALDYAAYRVGCVDQECPDEKTRRGNREQLVEQQTTLRDLLARCVARERIVSFPVDLPPEAEKASDGTYPDAVDAMFGQYELAFHHVKGQLKQMQERQA